MREGEREIERERERPPSSFHHSFHISGGYSTTNIFHAEYNFGMIPKSDLENHHVPNHVTSSTTMDYNGLYATVLTTYLPYKNYRILRPEDCSLQYLEIVKNLTDLNLDYFLELSSVRKMGILLKAEIDFDHNEALTTSLDFSNFPSFRTVEINELSEDQQREAAKLRKNVSREPPKLVSTCEKTEVTDFIENLLFMLVHQSCKIVKVNLIVTYEHSDYFKNYISFLQKQRALATSSIEGKMVKALGKPPMYFKISVFSLLVGFV